MALLGLKQLTGRDASTIKLLGQAPALGGAGTAPCAVAILGVLFEAECLEQTALGYGTTLTTGQGFGVRPAVERRRVLASASCQGSPARVVRWFVWRRSGAWDNMNVEQVDLQSEEDRRPGSFPGQWSDGPKWMRLSGGSAVGAEPPNS